MTREFSRGKKMYCCIATIRKLDRYGMTEYTAARKGKNKGDVLKGILNDTKGNIIFIEELEAEEYAAFVSNE